jgi:hypothetical protein
VSDAEFVRAAEAFESSLFPYRGETFEIAELGRDAVLNAQQFASALEERRRDTTLAENSVDALLQLLIACQAAGL